MSPVGAAQGNIVLTLTRIQFANPSSNPNPNPKPSSNPGSNPSHDLALFRAGEHHVVWR